MRTLAPALFLLALTGCAAEETRFRPLNTTGLTLERVVLGGHDFGDIGPDSNAEFYVADAPIYDFTDVVFKVGEHSFAIIPLDHVGDEPLDPGDWTYLIKNVEVQSGEFDVEAEPTEEE